MSLLPVDPQGGLPQSGPSCALLRPGPDRAGCAVRVHMSCLPCGRASFL